MFYLLVALFLFFCMYAFSHPWSTVVHAAYRKYPNPMNGAVTGIDVVRQNYDQGKLQTERIIQSRFSIPTWATKVCNLI